MEYKIAKLLKDAGYPQRETGNVEGFPGYVGYGLGFLYNYNNEEPVYSPTLSEVIESCGDKFFELTRYSSSWAACGNETGLDGRGNTPEEAVANLWLLINKLYGKENNTG